MPTDGTCLTPQARPGPGTARTSAVPVRHGSQMPQTAQLDHGYFACAQGAPYRTLLDSGSATYLRA
jgi:hypothetical protein